MNNKNPLRVAVLVLAIGLIAAACGSSEESGNETTTTTAAETTTTTEPTTTTTVMADPMLTLDVTGFPALADAGRR